VKTYSNKMIVKAVEKRRLTTRGLAKFVNQANPEEKNLSHTTCSRMLQKNYNPKVSHIEMFAKAFGFSPRSMFIEDQEGGEG